MSVRPALVGSRGKKIILYLTRAGTFIWWLGWSGIRASTRWLITLSSSEITFFFSEGVYYSFLERVRDFVTAIDAKLPDAWVLSSYLFACHQYIRNTAAFMNRNGASVQRTYYLYTTVLEWNSMGKRTDYVNFSGSLCAVFWNGKDNLCFFTHPNVSVRCQPTRNPHSFMTWKLIFSYL